MLKTKIDVNTIISIPADVIKKLRLKNGTVVEAKVEKGKLLILGKKNEIAKIMQYAGIWEKEDVDRIFREIRREWDKWQKIVPV